jgi:hypothetical protein
MVRWIVATVVLGGLSLLGAACGNSTQPKAAASNSIDETTSTLGYDPSPTVPPTTVPPTAVPPTTVPPTTVPLPPVPTTQAPVVFPPQSYSDALALANSGGWGVFHTFDTHGNDDPSCRQTQYDVTVVQGLSSQQIAADLLSYFFFNTGSAPSMSGCGGVSIDAYNNQSDASPNSATAGEASAGNVQLVSSNGHLRQVFVDVGPATAPTVKFQFTY